MAVELSCVYGETTGGFDHLSHASCCSATLSPIKDGLHQLGEGCDGRCVQAPLGDASTFECS